MCVVLLMVYFIWLNWEIKNLFYFMINEENPETRKMDLRNFFGNFVLVTSALISVCIFI